MKFFYFLFLSILIAGCKGETESAPDAAAEMDVDAIFQKNSETVLANLKGWQNENVDYSAYADDFVSLETGVNREKDSLNLDDIKKGDRQMWDMFNFKMLNEPQLLPGVNPDTKKMDGSVRHYSEWEVTRPATDSTEEKSGKIMLYETFEFNDDGKIVGQSLYGDFTGLWMQLMGDK